MNLLTYVNTPTPSYPTYPRAGKKPDQPDPCGDWAWIPLLIELVGWGHGKEILRLVGDGEHFPRINLKKKMLA